MGIKKHLSRKAPCDAGILMDTARVRLANERKELQSSRPVGCWAKPTKAKDGSVDLFCWEAGIKPLPGSHYTLPEDSDGVYHVKMKFKADFPATAPEVYFTPPIFHTNCFPSDGRVCLSLLLQEGHHKGAGHHGFWQASLRLAEILKALQVYLDEPNPKSVVSQSPERGSPSPLIATSHFSLIQPPNAPLLRTNLVTVLRQILRPVKHTRRVKSIMKRLCENEPYHIRRSWSLSRKPHTK